MRDAAAQQGDLEFQSLFAGQGAPRARALPAAELISRLIAEINDALSTSA
jgi:NAD(P)H-dependent flavin oxidoreductase YrpB (nitropropane dioxygenase family)